MLTMQRAAWTCPGSRRPGFARLAGSSPAPIHHDRDTQVWPKPTAPDKAHSALCLPGQGSPGRKSCLLKAMGHIWTEPEGRPSKSHKTGTKMEGAAHPPWKEGTSSKGGAPGPRSLAPPRSSYRGARSLLQNPTGEGPAPRSGLHPLRKAPSVPSTRGPGHGAGAWAWTDLQTCPEDRWSVCVCVRVGGGQGAEVVQCTTRTCLPSLHQHSGEGTQGPDARGGLGMILGSNRSPGPLPASKSDT